MNLNKFSKECHKNAKAKGWWDKPRPVPVMLMLIVTELAEAVEEVRSNKPAVYFNTPTGVVTDKDLGGGWNLKVGDVPQKPEGFIIEIADAVIRGGDLAGHEDVDIEHFKKTSKFNKLYDFPSDPVEAMYEMVQIVASPTNTLTEALTDLMAYAFNYCESNEMDLEKAIECKIEYNKSRAYRHGGKAC